jgi:uncharacterized membrane protein
MQFHFMNIWPILITEILEELDLEGNQKPTAICLATNMPIATVPIFVVFHDQNNTLLSAKSTALLSISSFHGSSQSLFFFPYLGQASIVVTNASIELQHSLVCHNFAQMEICYCHQVHTPTSTTCYVGLAF